ncbi:MAG: iron complex outermembrane recepter protein [Bacteroidetes bacterium]|nr:MAG: iron complex outermembrane recepter protein [Bacteroidota bacterium]
MKIITILFAGLGIVLSATLLNAQNTDANVFGDVKSNGEHVPFVNIYLEGTNTGTTTDATGHYMLINLPEGEHTLVARSLGYVTSKKAITVVRGKTQEVNFILEEETMMLNQVVITGTKTFKRQTESAVIVNVLESKALDMVQACNISEGLRFQPGLRVETDCQTCNYTQLRMNGLGGSYSQILINGRPVFSPLMGLYGMEQIPANMVDRIEIVRGGGSAIYGSSAIGGTVNVITRIPNESSFDFSSSLQSINNEATDNIFTGNLTMLTKTRKAGAAVYINRRNREAYDHNNDKFSELPEMKNNSFGANLFYKPSQNQKIELTLSSLSEYRYGGEMKEGPAYLAQQSEERTHNILMGGVDYQINFNEDNSSFIAYIAGQSTDRKHYTGILPDGRTDLDKHLADPPYGYTTNFTFQSGLQFNQRFENFPVGKNVFTFGLEYLVDDVFDTIPSYNYEIDQQTGNFAGFVQSDWEINQKLTLLAGLRADNHNMVDKPVISPRVSVLYKVKKTGQLRLTWGTGFRAPQAFDTDMHIAFAGGGVSRITLGNGLKEERSNSLSGSYNFDKATETFIVGFTTEYFYTRLTNVFYLQPSGSDEFGELFVKRNGQGATVHGGTLELRGNYNRKMQVEAGFTVQSSFFDHPVENIEGVDPVKEFLRSPNEYGYLTLSFTPDRHFNASLSSVYTGKMKLVHFAGAPEQNADVYKTSESFAELNLKMSYTLFAESVDSGIEFFAGVRNLLNAYQSDFDSGKNRDSNYVYGPGAPRTIFIGLRIRSL